MRRSSQNGNLKGPREASPSKASVCGEIVAVFEDVWRDQKGTKPPKLHDETVLLDTGLDSLGFAIIVTRLEEELGYDPFSVSNETFYPQTFKEFVQFYDAYHPKK